MSFTSDHSSPTYNNPVILKGFLFDISRVNSAKRIIVPKDIILNSSINGGYIGFILKTGAMIDESIDPDITSGFFLWITKKHN